MKYVTTVLASTVVIGFLLGISVNGFSQDSKTQPSDQNLKDAEKDGSTGSRPSVHPAQARGSWRAHRRRYTRHPA